MSQKTRVNTKWYIHPVNCYVTMKRKEPFLHEIIWVNIINTVWRKQYQTKKNTYDIAQKDKILVNSEKNRDSSCWKGT
jgi:hypothetical protein